MASTPEGKVKKAIKKWLDDRGVWYCMPIGTTYGNSGVPDFVCCWRGRFLAIEAKAPGKRGNVSANQERQIMQIHQAGGAALVVDDVSQLAILEQSHAEIIAS